MIVVDILEERNADVTESKKAGIRIFFAQISPFCINGKSAKVQYACKT